ncbi:MAG: hypothetical protein LUG52_00895 [Clostridia bacterium]|nr:hypothetical protein [Clostridia bacterium]
MSRKIASQIKHFAVIITLVKIAAILICGFLLLSQTEIITNITRAAIVGITMAALCATSLLSALKTHGFGVLLEQNAELIENLK